MRLVTFQTPGEAARAGAFIERDQAVLDLRQAAQAVHGGSADALASVLSLIEAGPAASELARGLIARAPSAAVRQRSEVKILAPIQPPPQMRDCSCFELHLKQSLRCRAQGACAAHARPRSHAGGDEHQGRRACHRDLPAPADLLQVQPLRDHRRRRRRRVAELQQGTRLRAGVRLLHRQAREGRAQERRARLHLRLHHLQRHQCA
jgi:hypothetical protein